MKLMGNRDIEDSLDRLDKLTQDEARMASVEVLKMMHDVDRKVIGVDDRVRGVEGQVQGVYGVVQDVRVHVQDVRVDMQDVRGGVRDVINRVQDVDDRVQGIVTNVRTADDKLGQPETNRSSSFQTLIIVPRAQTASQRTSS